MSKKGPVIIIDDDEDDLQLAKEILTNIEVTNPLRLFNNGLEALEYLKVTNEKPFLIICDINMPVMNGLELRKEICNHEYLKQKSIPFIFLSTAVSPATVNLAYELTVQGFFIKGTSLTEFQEDFKIVYSYWQKCKHPNMQ